MSSIIMHHIKKENHHVMFIGRAPKNKKIKNEKNWKKMKKNNKKL